MIVEFENITHIVRRGVPIENKKKNILVKTSLFQMSLHTGIDSYIYKSMPTMQKKWIQNI